MEYVYAALLLHKLGKEITEENIKKTIEAAGGKVDESRLKTVVASLKGVDIEKALKEAATMAATTKTETGTAAEKKEEKKVEEKKEKKSFFAKEEKES